MDEESGPDAGFTTRRLARTIIHRRTWIDHETVDLEVECDGVRGASRAHIREKGDGISVGTVRGILERTDDTVRLTIANGRVEEISCARRIHSASLAMLAAEGVTLDQLRTWAATLVVWSQGDPPHPPEPAPHPDLRYLMGTVVHVRVWDERICRSSDPLGFDARYTNGSLTIPGVPDTVATALTGRLLDEVVRLPGMVGLGFRIVHVHDAVDGMRNTPITVLRLEGELVELD